MFLASLNHEYGPVITGVTNTSTPNVSTKYATDIDIEIS